MCHKYNVSVLAYMLEKSRTVGEVEREIDSTDTRKMCKRKATMLVPEVHVSRSYKGVIMDSAGNDR